MRFRVAAQIAAHLRRDLELDRVLFILGGWTEGGYDCRHPDNLPANPECGGNELNETGDHLRCSQCSRRWPIHDGIYDFKEPLPS